MNYKFFNCKKVAQMINLFLFPIFSLFEALIISYEENKEHNIVNQLREKESGVAQSCPILCDLTDCSLPCYSIHGIFQAIVLEWAAISFSRDLPNPGIEPGYPALQTDALPSEPPGKSKRRCFMGRYNSYESKQTAEYQPRTISQCITRRDPEDRDNVYQY